MKESRDHNGDEVKLAPPAIPLATLPGDRYVPTRRGRNPGRPVPLVRRMVLLSAGAALFALLAVARCLTPDPSGHGTHRQLGLPPCTLVMLFGKTCPTCGMTTAWAHVTRGELRQAAAANVGGTLLGISAALSTPWLILSAAAGRWLIVRPTETGLIIYALILLVIVALDWWIKTGGL